MDLILHGFKIKICQAYNPEDDEGEDVKVVHPKTDEQRTRLQERVQSQLLFRTLDQDQLIEVGAQLIIKSSVMQLSKVPD